MVSLIPITGAYKKYGDWLEDVEGRDLHHTKVFPIFWERAEMEAEIVKKLAHRLPPVKRRSTARISRRRPKTIEHRPRPQIQPVIGNRGRGKDRLLEVGRRQDLPLPACLYQRRLAGLA